MALSFVKVGTDQPVGNQRRTVTDVTMDNSYASGGESVTAGNLRLTAVDSANTQIQSIGSTTVNIASCSYDPSTSLVHIYDETPAEVTSTGDLSGVKVRITAFGI